MRTMDVSRKRDTFGLNCPIIEVVDMPGFGPSSEKKKTFQVSMRHVLANKRKPNKKIPPLAVSRVRRLETRSHERAEWTRQAMDR